MKFSDFDFLAFSFSLISSRELLFSSFFFVCPLKSWISIIFKYENKNAPIKEIANPIKTTKSNFKSLKYKIPAVVVKRSFFLTFK